MKCTSSWLKGSCRIPVLILFYLKSLKPKSFLATGISLEDERREKCKINNRKEPIFTSA
jgi:hypothetical protein